MRALLFIAALLLPDAAQGQEAQADVLLRPVARGEILAASDFEARPVQAALARTALRATDAAGQAARRGLMAGGIVRAMDVQPPALVKRGEAVTLSVRSGHLVITAPGRALSDGGQGDDVRVVNLATNHTLQAVVEAQGRVRVTAP